MIAPGSRLAAFATSANQQFAEGGFGYICFAGVCQLKMLSMCLVGLPWFGTKWGPLDRYSWQK